jgi:uncharacterized protein
MTLARPRPAMTSDSLPFWTGGERGELLIEQCDACRYFIHPPTGFCPECESRETHYQPVSGKAFVETFTINHKQWMPGMPERMVLAMVRLAEAPHVRLVTNIVDCDPDVVAFDMPVAVRFEQNDDIWVPLFAPEAAA